MTTGAQIRAALAAVGGIGGQKWTYDELAKGADQAMAQAGITTREGAAVFISQCMVESAYWRTTVEYGSNLRYDPYRGRGFIQCTFESNYRGFGRWCQKRGLISDSEYFVKNPARLGDYKWAWLTATWYLSNHRHDLIKLANEGQIDAVGKGVHAGDAYASWYPNAPFHRNRMDHTRKAYRALLAAGITAPTGAPSTGAVVLPGVGYSVKQIQELVGVTVDGIAGPATVAAIKEIQSALGLTPDGVVGPATEAAMASIIEKIDALAADVKQIKSDTRHMPKRVWSHRIETPGSVSNKFKSANPRYTAGGLLGYNVIDFYTEGRSEETLKMLNEIDKAVSAEEDS